MLVASGVHQGFGLVPQATVQVWSASQASLIKKTFSLTRQTNPDEASRFRDAPLPRPS